MGDQAAEQVAVEVRIAAGTSEEAQGGFVVDLLPGGASSSGVIVFLGVPEGDVDAQAHVVGYRLP
jgi:hypothetical protein